MRNGNAASRGNVDAGELSVRQVTILILLFDPQPPLFVIWELTSADAVSSIGARRGHSPLFLFSVLSDEKLNADIADPLRSRAGGVG